MNRFDLTNEEAQRRAAVSKRRTVYAILGKVVKVPFGRDPNAFLLHDRAVCPICGETLAQLVRHPFKDPFEDGDSRPPPGRPLQMIRRENLVLHNGEWRKSSHLANKRRPVVRSPEREVELLRSGRFRQYDLPQKILCDCGVLVILDSARFGALRGGSRIAYRPQPRKKSRRRSSAVQE